MNYQSPVQVAEVWITLGTVPDSVAAKLILEEDHHALVRRIVCKCHNACLDLYEYDVPGHPNWLGAVAIECKKCGWSHPLFRSRRYELDPAHCRSFKCPCDNQAGYELHLGVEYAPEESSVTINAGSDCDITWLWFAGQCCYCHDTRVLSNYELW